MDETELYAAITPQGLHGLIAAFYRRIPGDPILGPMYPPDDLVGAEARLHDFIAYRLGGPDDYIRTRGHPRLRMRHAPFAIDRAARDRWMELMTAAADEVALAPAVRAPLLAFLGDVATFMINRP
ncbi:MAG: globin [Planctomycetota bacterium]